MREPGLAIVGAGIALLLLAACTAGKPLSRRPSSANLEAAIGSSAPLPRLERINATNAADADQLMMLSLEGFSRVQGSQCSVAFSPDGTLLACAAGRSALPVWELPSTRLLFSLQKTPTHEVAVAFSPDGTALLVGGASGAVRVFDPSTGALLRTLEALPSTVWDLDFDPSGKRLATVAFTTGLRVWDFDKGTPAWEFQEGTSGAYFLSVDYNPSGTMLALGKTVDGVTVLEAGSGRVIAVLPIQSNVGDVAFSPDGQILATGSDDNLARLWNANDFRLMRTLEGHSHFVNGVAFSPDGSLLATGSHDGTVGIWEVATGRRLATLSGHGQPVLRIAFDPSGTLLASASWDGTVRLWGVASGT
ncbi:MAG: WD40 repeat domain-containing protein [Spirochaetales bacterium]|nr:MAG: WD40 repeat domain-containing protein [Spirochaetales bacterium]